MKTTNSRSSESSRLLLLAILALIGLGVSIALSHHYYTLRVGMAAFKSFCNMGSQMNCDAVAASPYAELIGGFPLSSFAAGYFLTLLIVAMMGRDLMWRREAVRAAFALTLFGAVLSTVYLVIMATAIKTFCLLCLVLDAVILAGLVLVMTLKPEGTKKHPLDRAKWKSFTTTGVISLAVMVLGLKIILDPVQLRGSDVDYTVNQVLNTAPVAVNAGAEFPSMGPSDAPITIVEFSDFQCPFCRSGALVLHSVMQRFPGKVRVVLRNFPIDPSCNPHVQSRGHPSACEAAKVAVCANRLGKFEPVYEEMFENQASLAPGVPTQMAHDKGLSAEQLKACVDSPEVKAAVARDIDEAVRLGVQSTPTFFLNGRKIEGAFPAPIWVKIIDQLLANPGK